DEADGKHEEYVTKLQHLDELFAKARTNAEPHGSDSSAVGNQYNDSDSDSSDDSDTGRRTRDRQRKPTQKADRPQQNSTAEQPLIEFGEPMEVDHVDVNEPSTSRVKTTRTDREILRQVGLDSDDDVSTPNSSEFGDETFKPSTRGNGRPRSAQQPKPRMAESSSSDSESDDSDAESN